MPHHPSDADRFRSSVDRILMKNQGGSLARVITEITAIQPGIPVDVRGDCLVNGTKGIQLQIRWLDSSISSVVAFVNR